MSGASGLVAASSEKDRLELSREITTNCRTFILRVTHDAGDRVAVELSATDDIMGGREIGFRGEVLVSDLVSIAVSLRPLLEGVAVALGSVPTGRSSRVDRIRRRYPNAYRAWTDEEEARLTDRFRLGLSMVDLAREFGRQPSYAKCIEGGTAVHRRRIESFLGS